MFKAEDCHAAACSWLRVVRRQAGYFDNYSGNLASDVKIFCTVKGD